MGENGQVSEAEALGKIKDAGFNEAAAKRVLEGIKKKDQARRERVSPAGAIEATRDYPLLEKRRLEFGIPDGAFRIQATYDRCFIYQYGSSAAEAGKRTYGEGPILMPEEAVDHDLESAPKGVLIGAGPVALDAMTSNGIQLGDVVLFNKLSPYRFHIDTIAGRRDYMVLVRAGDICGSEDLQARLDRREARIQIEDIKDEEGRVVERQHLIKQVDGSIWTPTMPWIGDDR